jgi:hypothetical protein
VQAAASPLHRQPLAAPARASRHGQDHHAAGHRGAARELELAAVQARAGEERLPAEHLAASPGRDGKPALALDADLLRGPVAVHVEALDRDRRLRAPRLRQRR